MKKSWLVLLIVIAMALFSCNGKVHDDTVKTDNESILSFTMLSDSASAEKEIVITVCTKENPGFLALALTVEYDIQAMQLTKIENGKDFTDYNFVPAKDLREGCRVCWFTNDIQNAERNGELLKLYFTVSDNVRPGEYPVSVLPVPDGCISGGDKKTLPVANGELVISIK